jgi:hypothetical protein
MQTLSFKNLTAADLTSLVMTMPEDPIDFLTEALPDGVHGITGGKVPVYAFSLAALISAMIWLSNQEGNGHLDLTVSALGATIQFSISKEEAHEAIERARALPAPKPAGKGSHHGG